MTVNGVMAVILRYLALGLITSTWLNIDHLRQKCRPKNLGYSNISFRVIFVEVTVLLLLQPFNL